MNKGNKQKGYCKVMKAAERKWRVGVSVGTGQEGLIEKATFWSLTQGMLAHIENLIRDVKELKEQPPWIWGEESSRQRKQQAQRPWNKAAPWGLQKQLDWCGWSGVSTGGWDHTCGEKKGDHKGLCSVCVSFSLSERGIHWWIWAKKWQDPIHF